MQDLRAFYKRERDGMVNSLADDLRLRSLVVSNTSSGMTIEELNPQQVCVSAIISLYTYTHMHIHT